MDMENNRWMGQLITRLINKENLSQHEAFDAFCRVLGNEVTEMQQGAFLAALTAKGETAAEVAGGWRAIYERDTNKVAVDDGIVDNCGTGMDSFKTFNISTAASLVAAAGGVRVARHGARAISSSCGTVDMVEALGIDVECSVDLVAKSIDQAGIGIFNGMSPEVHPMALGRILSQICFGSPLNIAASLAHPALPKIAVRGVYSPALLQPVAEVMQAIGYTDALVLYGSIAGSEKGMDEASVCGTTSGVRLQGGTLSAFSLEPEECGIERHNSYALRPDADRRAAAVNMYCLLRGQGEAARLDAVCLNSAMIFLLKGLVTTLVEGVEKSREILRSGAALTTLKRWVEVQNSDPTAGFVRLAELEEASRCMNC